MKLIIAGSRTIFLTTEEVAEAVAASGYTNIDEVVSGTCRGVDISGEVWAKGLGIKVTRFPALWGRYGKLAGPRRNAVMAKYADALLAVPGKGTGTLDMIGQMKELGKPVFVWVWDVKPRVRFCWECGKKLWGNIHVEQMIFGHLRILHKHCVKHISTKHVQIEGEFLGDVEYKKGDIK